MSSVSQQVSLKSIAMLFPTSSMQRVYLHGMWQMSRNRRPSEPLGNERNPIRAFSRADAKVGAYLDELTMAPYARKRSFWTDELVKKVIEFRPIEDLVRT